MDEQLCFSLYSASMANGRAYKPDDERQVQVRLTPRGREIRDECGCLGEELLVRSGMTVEQLGKLNRKVQALRDAVAG